MQNGRQTRKRFWSCLNRTRQRLRRQNDQPLESLDSLDQKNTRNTQFYYHSKTIMKPHFPKKNFHKYPVPNKQTKTYHNSLKAPLLKKKKHIDLPFFPSPSPKPFKEPTLHCRISSPTSRSAEQKKMRWENLKMLTAGFGCSKPPVFRPYQTCSSKKHEKSHKKLKKIRAFFYISFYAKAKVSAAGGAGGDHATPPKRQGDLHVGERLLVDPREPGEAGRVGALVAVVAV